MRRRQTLLRALLLALLASLMLVGWAWADPPTRAGRVAQIQGTAWWLDHETREWVQLLRNQTVAEGDRLRTESSSRLRLQVGSTTLWLDGDTELEFRQLDDRQAQLQLQRGGLGLRLRQRDALDEWQVLTEEGSSRFEREGLFRLQQQARATTAQVWSGRMRFEARDLAPGEATAVLLRNNEQGEFWREANGPRAQRESLQRDEFARWLLAESQRMGEAVATAYVSPEMTGADELDRWGDWSRHSEWGMVWMPRHVAVDWAPYSHGRWVWSRHWGWTWVDEAPWGFAPFHYGRWVRWGVRWCWVPGSWVARPAYAPALVTWGGVGVQVNLNLGRHRPPPVRGWAPLTPRDEFRPHYRHSPEYGRRFVFDPVTVQRPVGGPIGQPNAPVPVPPRGGSDVPVRMGGGLPAQGGGMASGGVPSDAAAVPSPGLPWRVEPVRDASMRDGPAAEAPRERGWRNEPLRERQTRMETSPEPGLPARVEPRPEPRMEPRREQRVESEIEPRIYRGESPRGDTQLRRESGMDGVPRREVRPESRPEVQQPRREPSRAAESSPGMNVPRREAPPERDERRGDARERNQGVPIR
ncbi:DUF6600 domain-containing protein [Roseateles sp. BYS180W]|uniref:DUF6600 domain-containing protein n=1 Tax=Roseateles rivi TaxID=3299028 RepID=A0ABW7FVZ5_9BURK